MNHSWVNGLQMDEQTNRKVYLEKLIDEQGKFHKNWKDEQRQIHKTIPLALFPNTNILKSKRI